MFKKLFMKRSMLFTIILYFAILEAANIPLFPWNNGTHLFNIKQETVVYDEHSVKNQVYQ
jgi:hypothetical protein